MQQERLTIQQTATGYWTVRRGTIELAGAMTREGAERELELRRRLSESSHRRTGSRTRLREREIARI